MHSNPRFALASQLLLSVQAASANLFRGGEEDVWRKSDSLFSDGNRIIGGVQAEEDRYPYSVSLQDGGGHFCGGSLIGKDTVLTAAHCVHGEGTGFTIVVGSDDVDDGQEIGVREALEHPDYDLNTEEYDFALVFLEESTTLNIPLIRLNDDNSYPPPGSKCHTMGWGDTDPGDSQRLSDRLLVTDVEVISNQECADIERNNESYGSWIFDDMICADTDGQDACQGDSGGLLITRGANGPQSDVQVGVVSWGIGCAFLPGVYSRVSKGYGWIRETVCDESNDPPGSLCGTPEPTDQPTTIPTEYPTKFPTKQPTRHPTNFPTQNPTNEPTNKPTTTPSKSPSASPTPRPTLSPTLSPTTAEPTLLPTEQPTLVPSLSSAPTGSPSTSPTLSSRPSSQPTDSPSISLSPSGPPSSTPTKSSQPTESPSTSLSPSIAPTFMPTISHRPTMSFAPSAIPSSIPSGRPSSLPSSQPSTFPSANPSLSPTMSNAPSSFPSVVPSFFPSNSPTMTTSPSKSSNPTMSSVPSSMPSIEKSDRIIPGSSLLISGVTARADGDKESSNSSVRTGQSLPIGALLSGIISVWTMLS